MSDAALSVYREAAGVLTASGAFAVSQSGNARTRRLAGTATGLLGVFAPALAQHGDSPMFDFDGERSSYADVFAAARRLASGLARAYDIAPGDRIGLAMRNRAEWFPAFFAIQLLGAVGALLNSRGSSAELAAMADDVGCRLILVDERVAERLAGATDLPVVDPVAQSAFAAQDDAAFTPRPRSGDDPALILFTSGTTGRAKGATLTHANLACAARQVQYIAELGLTLAARRTGMALDDLRARSRTPAPLLIVPLYHISGIITIMSASFGGGMSVGLRRWDAAAALDAIERCHVTQVSGPSLVMDDLLSQPDAAERLSNVTGVVVAGQASPIAMSQRVRAAMPRANQAAGWGMTELTGSVSSASGAVFDAQPGSVGFVLPLVDVELRGGGDAAVRPGEVGEIAVRGPVVMQGYWNRPEADAEVFDGEWFLTGDLGRFDDSGLLTIVDRAKDMVISAGENIYCAEVEKVLSMVEHHAEVALFGVPDDRLGERAVAAVTIAEACGIAPDGEAVRAHARLHLADYKVPGEVVFDLGPLPRNGLGKVDKVALRARYHERAAAAAAAPAR